MHLELLSDDEVQTRVLTAAAERRGFTTSARGLSASSAHLSRRVDEPAVVLIDCERLDRPSLAIVKQCAEVWPDAPVLVLVEHIAPMGVALPPSVRYVQSKPFHIPALLDRVEDILSTAPRRSRVVGMRRAPITGDGDRITSSAREGARPDAASPWSEPRRSRAVGALG